MMLAKRRRRPTIVMQIKVRKNFIIYPIFHGIFTTAPWPRSVPKEGDRVADGLLVIGVYHKISFTGQMDSMGLGS